MDPILGPTIKSHSITLIMNFIRSDPDLAFIRIWAWFFPTVGSDFTSFFWVPDSYPVRIWIRAISTCRILYSARLVSRRINMSACNLCITGRLFHYVSFNYLHIRNKGTPSHVGCVVSILMGVAMLNYLKGTVHQFHMGGGGYGTFSSTVFFFFIFRWLWSLGWFYDVTVWLLPLPLLLEHFGPRRYTAAKNVWCF